MKLVVFSLVILCLLPAARMDLPVHCIASDMAGEWLFHLGPLVHPKGYNCGHNTPDENLDHVGKDPAHFFRDTEPMKDLRVSLKLPNQVFDLDRSEEQGRWTMVYDEGFEIFLSEMTYFAFSRYHVTDANPTNQDTEETAGYQSDCDGTFVGWYYEAHSSGHWGCFYAEKTSDGSQQILDDDDPETEADKIYDPLSGHVNLRFASLEADWSPKFREEDSHFSFHDVASMHHGSQPPHSEIERGNFDRNALFEPDFSFVELVNSHRRVPWKAKVHDHFNGRTKHEMHKLLGSHRFLHLKKSHHERSILGDGRQVLRSPKTTSFLQLSESSHTLFSSEPLRADLPLEYDWRDVDGVNYDSDVKSQGACGSCYAIASTSVMESRIKIYSAGKQSPRLSPANIIGCSGFNQGCQGGYPYLIGKYGAEFGWVDESCNPYEERDSVCQESCFDDSASVYKTRDYGYVGGGFYGGCNENAIMEEIYKNGPVVVAFQATTDLYYYHDGIYTVAPTKKLGRTLNRVKPWEPTNHALVAVGWGQEEVDGKVMKYWILKNSWGSNWGKDGYFKLLRGFDLGGIENQAVFLIPDIERKDRFWERLQ